MKTPREILLRKHQAVSPKLDAIRARVVAEIARAPAPETMSWRQWLWPCPRAWAGLAAAWLVILGMNLAAGKGPSRPASARLAVSRQELLELRRQQRMLAILKPGRETDGYRIFKKWGLNASVIGFVELTKAGSMISNTTFKPFSVFGCVALLYFALCFPISLFAKHIERKTYGPRT